MKAYTKINKNNIREWDIDKLDGLSLEDGMLYPTQHYTWTDTHVSILTVMTHTPCNHSVIENGVAVFKCNCRRYKGPVVKTKEGSYHSITSIPFDRGDCLSIEDITFKPNDNTKEWTHFDRELYTLERYRKDDHRMVIWDFRDYHYCCNKCNHEVWTNEEDVDSNGDPWKEEPITMCDFNPKGLLTTRKIIKCVKCIIREREIMIDIHLDKIQLLLHLTSVVPINGDILLYLSRILWSIIMK